MTQYKLIAREPTKEQKRAYYLVKRAILTGELVRPKSCSQCDKSPKKAKDGRSLIEAHHHLGYKFPLSVQWLCVWCHRSKQTPTYPNGRPYVRGEANGVSRLTEKEVRKIKKFLVAKHPFRALARQFDVDKQTIKRIYKGETWSWLKA